MKIAIVNFDSKPISPACAVICQGLAQLNHQVWMHSEATVSSNGAYPAKIQVHKYYNSLENLGEVDLIIIDITFNTFIDYAFLYHFTKKIVLIDNNDVANFRNTPAEFTVFSCHINSNIKKNSKDNKLPLPFGISQELIDFTDRILDNDNHEKINKIAYNFTPSYAQSVRASLEYSFIPSVKRSIFQIDTSRHSHDDYLINLSHSTAVISYGGDFIQDVKKNSWLIDNTNQSNVGYFFDFFEGNSAIVRWDSWRFYESCACGAIPIHLDFIKYGFQLPSMPVPWKHYLPIDLEYPTKLLDEMVSMYSSDPLIFKNLGRVSRSWAISSFGPIGMANYFLSQIKN